MIITYPNEDFANSVGKKNMKLPTKVKIERINGHIIGESWSEMREKPTKLHLGNSLVG